MIVVEICKDFGWTYEQYLDQPTVFIDLIKDKMRIDGQRQANEAKKAKSKQ